MSRQWRPRLVAYEPLGPMLGVLPQPFSWTFTQSDDTRSTLSVEYPLDSAHSEWIKAGCEIAVEYPTWENENDDRPVWTEPVNARLVALEKSRDRMDRVETFKYTFVGIDYLLDRAWVQERNVQDPEDGDQPAERTFPGPGMTPAHFGRVFDKLWDEVIAATGWGGSVPGHELTKSFGDVVDSNDAPWTVELEGTVGLEEPLSNVVKRFTDAEAVTIVWHGRDMRAYDGLSYLDDLTDSVTIRDGDFVVKSPQVVDWQPPATHVRVMGADGRTWDFENLDQDTPHGTPEMIMLQRRDCTTEAKAQRHANQAFREAKVVEHLTAEANFGASRFKPWQHYNLWSKVKRERGRLSDERHTVDVAAGQVRSISVTVDNAGVRGHLIFGDRRRRLGERAARQLAEIGGGSRVGPGGLVRRPGDDPRLPDLTAAAAPTVTTTTVADHNNRPRGQIEVTQLWASSVPALDPDGAVSEHPIRVTEWVYEAKRTGKKWKEILRASADDTSNTVKVEQLWDPEETIQLRRAAVSHAGKGGAWQTLTSATWTTDVDAAMSADLILDSNHRNAAIRTNRAAAAGAGFAFTQVSSQYIAEFTSTTPELDYAWGGNKDSGRRQCRVGDVIVTDCEAALAAGTSATLRVRVRWYLEDGSVANTATITQAVTSGTYTTFTGTATAPALAAGFAVRVSSTSMSGTTPKLRVRKVNADRRTAESRMLDDAVIARVVHATDNLSSKHTSTGALFQATAGTSGYKTGTAGFFHYNGGSPLVEFNGGTVYIEGELVAGGVWIHDDVIEFDPGHSITYTGSDLIFTAVTGLKFATGATFDQSVYVTHALTSRGNTSLGDTSSTVGFYGSAGSTRGVFADRSLATNAGNTAIRDLLNAVKASNLITGTLTLT